MLNHFNFGIFVLDSLTLNIGDYQGTPASSRVRCLWALWTLFDVVLEIVAELGWGRSSDRVVIDFQAALFRNVTHLKIIESPQPLDEETSPYTGVALMPALTHISFYSKDICATLHPLFRTTLAGLQCIVFLSLSDDVESYDDDVRPYSDDDRFVLVMPIDFVDDWMRGATDGQDYWSLADELIAARAAGTMDRSRFIICGRGVFPED
ncbi:hypothetical protein C8R46DRAFT_1227325 [Mycena filopes]|nr:hypothetical protein C8R46DRAFT_1227325 [Mycena filopes]